MQEIKNQIILAIDPGPKESAFVIMSKNKIYGFVKIENRKIYSAIKNILWEYRSIEIDKMVIEMIASYGMPVGKSVFETCVWIGRFICRMEGNSKVNYEFITRQAVKMHYCHTLRGVKDANVNRVLIDKYASNDSNHGKGNKKSPGFFYGFQGDIFAAFAVGALYFEETDQERIERRRKYDYALQSDMEG